MQNEHRTEYLLQKNDKGEFIIPNDIASKQNRTNIPIYVINKDKGTLWLNEKDRDIKETPTKPPIAQNNIPNELLQIILHNDKTGDNDNIARLEYVMEASNALLTRNRGIISLPTGAGKTLVIATVVSQLQNKHVLIIAPTIVIVGQIKNLLKKLKLDNNINVLTHITASKIPPDQPNEQPKYDCIIFDECHKMACTTYLKSLFRSNTKIVYGLSASVSTWGSCSAKFHIGPLVYNLPYNKMRELKNSINGIKYFHKFEFGKIINKEIEGLKTELLGLEMEMAGLLHSVNGNGYISEMAKRQIIARYVNMGFLAAEKNDVRNMFIASIIKETTKIGLLNITFLRTKECGRLLIKKLPPKSTLFWCANGMYIYANEGDEKLKKVDYDYVNDNFGIGLNNILATSCLQMGVNLQFTHGTINSILLLSGSTHSSLAQQVGRAVRCNPSSLPAMVHTIIDYLPLLNTNATNRIQDLSRYLSLQGNSEFIYKQDNYINEYHFNITNILNINK